VERVKEISSKHYEVSDEDCYRLFHDISSKSIEKLALLTRSQPVEEVENPRDFCGDFSKRFSIELIEYIFSFLHPNHLRQLAQVNKSFRKGTQLIAHFKCFILMIFCFDHSVGERKIVGKEMSRDFRR
jgi:hypothetical protein